MPRTITLALLAGLVLPLHALAEDRPVGITATLNEAHVLHKGQVTAIRRNPDNKATITQDFSLTSRPCPPFCIQPMNLAPGVETIGELEVIGYAKRMSEGDDSILLVDSRTPNWSAKGTIPGAVNIPWTRLNPSQGADPISIAEIMTERFDVLELEGMFDYTDAKTLVLFCNGMWCGQSPANIRTLLRFGYPAHRLKWYRGGMQAWETLGLTTVDP